MFHTVRTAVMIAALLALPSAATAQAWGELDCKVVIDAFEASSQVENSLRHNADVLETALRGRDYALFEKQVGPKLEEAPAEEYDRALDLFNSLLRDRCSEH